MTFWELREKLAKIRAADARLKKLNRDRGCPSPDRVAEVVLLGSARAPEILEGVEAFERFLEQHEDCSWFLYTQYGNYEIGFADPKHAVMFRLMLP